MISAIFTPLIYTISASAGSGGSISPSGSVPISCGGSQSFSISPNSGYYISNVYVDGGSVGAVSSYTFANVTSAHTISAYFAQNVQTFTISVSAGSGGSISPGTTSVNYGGSQSFSISPDPGHNIAIVIVDGAPVGVVSSYTFANVTFDHLIYAIFY